MNEDIYKRLIQFSGGAALTIVVTYGVLFLFSALLVMIWTEDERRSGANASPGLCKTLGRGLRRLGEALGRFRRP